MADGGWPMAVLLLLFEAGFTGFSELAELYPLQNILLILQIR